MKKVFLVAICVIMSLTLAPFSYSVSFKMPEKIQPFSPLFSNINCFIANAETVNELYDGKCGDNAYWSLDSSTGVLKITGTGRMDDYSDCSFSPWYPQRELISSVVIDGVTTVGGSAFSYLPVLTSATISDSVIEIMDGAFAWSTELTNISIGENVTTIWNGAFHHCSNITELVIPDSVITICTGAFTGCTGLKGIIIPSSVTTIDSFLFEGCTGLKTIYISEGVKHIGDGVFYNCTELESIIIPDSVESLGEYAFYGCSKLTSIKIPDKVESIEKYSFYGCTELVDVIIGNGILSIGDFAFFDCDSIETLTMPVSAKIYNSSSTFGNCTNIKRVNLTKGTGTMQNYGLSTSTSSYETNYQYTPWYISNCNVVNISEGVNNIGVRAFEGCIGLTNITIPDGVTIIDSFSFQNCKNLTNVSFPNTLIEIDWYAFYGCNKLNNIIIPNSVTTIGWYAFENCSKLTNLTISDSVTTIGTRAFYGCFNLKKVFFTGDEEAWNAISYNDWSRPFPKVYFNHFEHTPGEWIITNQPKCTTEGKMVKLCLGCDDELETSIIEPIGHSYKEFLFEPTCTEDGYTNHVCSSCGNFYHTDSIPANGHTKGEWEYIGGKEYAKYCTVCGDKLESKIVTLDMFFNSENVNKKQVLNKSTATVTATVTDNFVNDLVFASSDSSTVFVDANGNVIANNIGKATITVTIKGTAISDSIEVEVLPRDFTVTWNVNGKQIKQTVKEEAKFTPNVNTTLKGYKFTGWDKTVPTTMPAENLTFTAQYELIVKQLKIKNPSTSTINYGETLVMHADFGGVELPEGWSIQWTVEGAGFNMAPAADGLTCKMTSVANGNATVKATLIDENGEAVLDADGNEMSDSKQLTSKAGFWQKFVSFFKNLFGISRIILQSV